MSVKQNWFARRYPLGAMRSGLAPVHWMGWVVRAGLVLGLGISVAVGFWLTALGHEPQGIALGVVLAFGSWLGVTRVAHMKADHVNCIADYREGRASV